MMLFLVIFVIILALLTLFDVGVSNDDLSGIETNESDQGCGCSTGFRGESKATTETITSSLSSIDGNLPNIEENMVFIPGGVSYIGTDKPVIIRDGEGPRRKVLLSPFYIDRYEVNNKGTIKPLLSTNYFV
ncbi:hypothetical protein EON65_09385 [archaeon]|nr:MAG: hypothetical protein EON65_09385 [archaeon]